MMTKVLSENFLLVHTIGRLEGGIIPCKKSLQDRVFLFPTIELKFLKENQTNQAVILLDTVRFDCSFHLIYMRLTWCNRSSQCLVWEILAKSLN